jgi:hypothetical protein
VGGKLPAQVRRLMLSERQTLAALLAISVLFWLLHLLMG